MTVGPSKIPPPRFEAWPLPPPRATNALVRPGGEAPDKAAPGTAAGEKRLYEFQADNIELKAALALFARANNLNIVPDQDATGVVTLNVRNLSLERMMQAMLEANDLSWTEEDGLIRVRTVQSRDFTVDYLRLVRNGQGSSAVTLSSSSITSGGGSGGGSQGGGGQGGGGGAGGGGGGAGGGGAAGGVGGQTGSQMNLKLDNAVEFWKELEEQLAKLLTARGKDTIAINRTAGIIQVTDRPSALKRVEDYLKQLSGSVSRQVDIEAKLYDVTLGDQFQFGINWARVATVGGGQFGALASPLGTPLDLTTVTPAASPGGGFDAKQSSITMLFSNRTSAAVLEALQEQGEVNVISQPRLRAMNNQTAIMKVGTDRPFFTQQTQTTASAAAQTTQSGDLVSIITIGTVLAVTPQIGGDGWITLDITPAITSFVEERKSPSGLSSAPVLDIKQSSTIVRLRDGETIVMGGLIQNSSAKSVRKVPLLGDIPWLGKLFQGRIEAKQKKELVIFLTPTLVQ
jgi:MSHA type pilus biogenesis protein MshL